jgi:glycerophosphoryl diester phosphodiesterase
LNLRRREGRPLVIGHRGAAAVAPENTLAALEVAVAAGVDLVEFDISPGLLLGHSELELPADSIDLDRALDYLRGHELGVHLDVKLPGYEADVVAAVRRHGLVDRAIFATAFAGSSRRLGVSRFRWPRALTQAGAAALRQAMPLRVPLLLRAADANILSLHHTLCSRAAIAASHRRGAPVLAWTANDPQIVSRLAGLGVDAIVSDDPAMALATLLEQ